MAGEEKARKGSHFDPVGVLCVVEGEAKVPKQAKRGDAGVDVFAKEEFTIYPGERKLVSTGLRVVIPEGYEFQVRPKSGLALNQLITVLNSPGTVDSGYRNEIGVILWRPLTFSDVTKLINSGVRQMLEQHDRYEHSKAHIGSRFYTAEYELEDAYHFAKGDKIAQLVLAKYSTPFFVEADELPDSERGQGGFGSTGK